MIGDVGIGKSTIVEKLTGEQRLSFSGGKSFTKDAIVYLSKNDRVWICDTPGSNPIEERYEHNIWIATAMSYKPVACLLIVVQARARMSNVFDEIIKYAEAFEPKEFTDIIAVCVTHMDTAIDWGEQEFRATLAKQTGIDHVVFSRLDKPYARLEADILGVCNKRPVNIDVNSENFLRFFKVNDRNFKILRSVRREVARFESIKKKFYESNEIFRRPENINVENLDNATVDLLFEFQAWMMSSIVEVQKRVSEENNFQFDGPEMANEAGHIANLTNQLKTVLLELRTRCLHFTSTHGINELRRCPHCGLVWAKIVGCEGATTCGALVNSLDVRKNRDGGMATYFFRWNEQSEELVIERSGRRQARRVEGGKGRGCGNTITWSSMALVEVPQDFCAAQEVSVDDITSLPRGAAAAWDNTFEAQKAKYKVKEAPSKFDFTNNS